MKNKFPLGDYEVPVGNKEVNLKGHTYKDLAKDYLSVRSRLDGFKLPIVCVETENDEIDLVEEMFSRLNQALSLSSAEQRNALGGNIVKLIRKTAAHKFFKKDVSFSNNRYQHYEVAVRLLFLEYCILEKKLQDTKRKALNAFTKEFKTRKPDPRIYLNVKNTLDKMFKIFQIHDDLLIAQGRVPIYYLLVRQAVDQRQLSYASRENIERFHNKVMDNKKISLDPEKFKDAKQDLIEYERATIQGTNDATSIQRRFEIICAHLKVKGSKIVEMDPR